MSCQNNDSCSRGVQKSGQVAKIVVGHLSERADRGHCDAPNDVGALGKMPHLPTTL